MADAPRLSRFALHFAPAPPTMTLINFIIIVCYPPIRHFLIISARRGKERNQKHLIFHIAD